MNAIKFRFTFALVIAGVLSIAGLSELARTDGLAQAESGDTANSFEAQSESAGGSSGGDAPEVRWSSFIPGSFK